MYVLSGDLVFNLVLSKMDDQNCTISMIQIDFFPITIFCEIAPGSV